ncbi:MAG: hypothetical protein ACLQAT_02190 [Candidatus Binataceae bacterium]
MKRIASLASAALLGVAVWYGGPGLRGTPQQAFAQAVGCAGVGPGTPLNANAAVPFDPACYDAYKLSYFDVATAFTPSVGGFGGPGSSGGTGDALLRIVDAGNFATVEAPAITTGLSAVAEPGAVCANIYVYNDVQEQQECCSCPLTANSLQTLSVINNLLSNPFNPKESLSAGVIKIVGSEPADPADCNNTVGAVTAATFITIAGGLHEWINHTETMASNQAGFKPTPFGFVTTASVEKFTNAVLDSGELANLQAGCAAINAADKFGSQAIGICKCGLGD